jgi:hypothetical protein
MLKTYISKRAPVKAIKISLKNLPEIIQVLEEGKRTYNIIRLRGANGLMNLNLVIGIKTFKDGDYVIVSGNSVFGMSESDFESSYEVAAVEVPLEKNYTSVVVKNRGKQGTSFALPSCNALYYKLREGTKATIIFGSSGDEHSITITAIMPITGSTAEFTILKANGEPFYESKGIAVIIV